MNILLKTDQGNSFLVSMWTKNFQMYKLDLEKAEKLEIKFPTSVESQKKQEIPEKNLFHLLH